MNLIPLGIRKPFAYQNYRYFLFGQVALLLAFGMQTIASSWLIYRLTGSEVLLGVINLLTMLPALLFAPFVGIIIDKFPKKNIIIATQSTLAATFAITGSLVVTDLIEVWHLMVNALCFGCILAVESPTRNAFVAELVNSKDLQNAVGLNAAVFNLGRFVGPAVSGFLIPFTGEGIIYIINSLASIVVIYTLEKITIINDNKEQAKEKHSMIEGFSLAFTDKTILYSLVILGIGAICLIPINVLLPVITVEIFKGDSQLLGIFSSSLGVGALSAAIYFASRTKSGGLLFCLGLATITFMLGMYAFVFLQNIYCTMLALFVIGFGSTLQVSTLNTLIQHVTPTIYKGRVFALFSMMVIGMGVFGSAFGGTGGAYLGIKETFALCALWLTFCTFILFPLMVKYTRVHHDNI